MTNEESNRKINSLEELHRLLPSILKEHGEDHQLTLAALANPILALEHLSYSFPPELRREIERRVRFGEEKSKKLQYVEESIFRVVGREFSLDSPYELSNVIKTLLLENTNPNKNGKETITQDEVTTIINIIGKPRSLQLPGSKQSPDPLEKYTEFHPIIPLLLEYREIDASVTRLSSKEVFESIFQGVQKLPIALTDIRFRYNPKKKNK